MSEEHVCEICHFPMTVVQDEPFGHILVCLQGHWWIYDFKTFRPFLVREGEQKDAA